MSVSKSKLKGLLSDYQSNLRKCWIKVAGDQASQLDGANQMASDLLEELDRPLQFEVGFIGRAQIGKSSLINAILADDKFPRILPTGGLGPLTANSMSVSFGERRSLDVEYHGIQQLNQMILPLRVKRKLEEINPAESEVEIGDIVTNRQDAEKRKKEVLSELNTLVSGNQYSNRPEEYLVAVVSSLIGKKPVEESTTLFSEFPDDRACYQKVIKTLALDSSRQVFTEDQSDFDTAIRDHAAGCLAPLVKSMKLNWPCELLRSGIIITDLPGVGVVGDKFPEVTKSWIMKKGRSVILVTDNSGIDESSERTLIESQFVQRLLFSVDNLSEDPISLTIVATQMDRLVNGIEDPGEAKQAFLKKVNDIHKTIYGQLGQLLNNYVMAETNEDVREKKMQVAQTVLDRTHIVPVSAHEFINTRLKSRRALFDEAETSQVPKLIGLISGQAQQYFEERSNRVQRRALHLAQQVKLAVDQISSRLDLLLETGGVSDQIRTEFQELARGLKVESSGRQGAFHNYVRRTVPESISSMTAEARVEAIRSYQRYCSNELADANWATIKAAIRRGGTFSGRTRIDLQDKICSILSELIAVNFPKCVIAPTRKEAQALINSHIQLTERAIEWVEAKKVSVRIKKDIEVVGKRLKNDAEALKDAGEDALRDLRNTVKSEIGDCLRDSIQDACDGFMRSGKASGIGVKSRMLELAKEAGNEAIDTAGDVAKDVLRVKFNEVFTKIVEKSLKVYQRDLVKEIEEIFETASKSLQDKALKTNERQVQAKQAELEPIRAWVKILETELSETGAK